MPELLFSNCYRCHRCGVEWVDETDTIRDATCPECNAFGCKPVHSEECPWFLNAYQCWRCNCAWTDEWSSACDDECPECGARACCAVRSEPLNEAAAKLSAQDWTP